MSEQDKWQTGRLTRRMLMTAAGTLTGGLALARTPNQIVLAPAPGESTARRGKSREFLADEPIQNVDRHGRKGFSLKVRLTSYRSLPLSCIEDIQLKIDGTPVDPKTIVLTLNNVGHTLDELPKLSDVWWFILDYGELFVPRDAPLPLGQHDVDAVLTTVEPYITAGRFSFRNPCRKQLVVESDL